MEELKYVYVLFCENNVYKEILGVYSSREKASIACDKFKNNLNGSGSCSLNFYIIQPNFNDFDNRFDA